MKKVGRANYGYYQSPALVKAGKNVLVWKVIWSCKKRKQQMSKAVRNQMWVTGQTERSISQLTISEIRIEMRKAVSTLKETQMDARRMRELWLEEMAIKNAMANGDMDAQKVLKTMIRKIHMQSMNSKINMVTHGE